MNCRIRLQNNSIIDFTAQVQEKAAIQKSNSCRYEVQLEARPRPSQDKKEEAKYQMAETRNGSQIVRNSE